MPGQDPKSPLNIFFSVKDTGIGIPKDRIAAVFESFTQAEGSTARIYGGTGLGLSISKELVAMMGGNIWVESEIGIGSVFHFTVPFNPGTIVNERVVEQELSAVPDAPLSILLAEDNVLNQKIAVNFLEKRGHRVSVANNGKEAIEILGREEFDLVLMDVHMPGMDGFETTRAIRDPNSQVLNHGVRIVAMTANAMAGDRERCIGAGMNDYVTKPIDKRAFFRAVESVPPIRTDASAQVNLPPDKAVDRVYLENKYEGDLDFIVTLLRLFLEDGPDRIKGIKKAFETNDAGCLELEAHTLRSVGPSIGAVRISSIAAEIEHAAKERDMEKALELSRELEGEYERITNAVNDLIRIYERGIK